MSYGYIPGITVFSPFHGSVLAVMESLAKLAAVGADPKDARLTFQEYFQRLHDDPTRWGQPAAALLGAFLAQKEMGVPSIGGKDSMSGSFNDLDVPPTLVSFALTMTKASQTGTAAFQKPGSKIVLIPLPMNSETELPNFESAKFLNSTIARLVREGKILSCSVVKEGGAAAAIAKMGFGNDIGAEIVAAGPSTLFAPLVGSFVAEVEDTACLSGLNHTVLGLSLIHIYKATHMNFLHCFYGIGVSLSPFLMSLALSAGSWRRGYRTVFWFQLAIAALTIVSLPLWKKVKHASRAAEGETGRWVGFLTLIKDGKVRMACSVFLGSCGLEYTCGVWGSTFLVQARGLPADAAALLINFYYVGIA